MDYEWWVTSGTGFGEDVVEGGEEGGAGGDAVWRRKEVGGLGVDDEQDCRCVAWREWVGRIMRG